MADQPTHLNPEQFRAAIQMLPGILSGRLPDPAGIALAFRLRVAVAFLEKVRLAFIVKSRGGTDDAGISWPPLTKEYLAYGRGPFSTRQAGGLSPGTVRGGNRDGQPKDGFMTPEQLLRWRKVYAASLKGQQDRWRRVYGAAVARLALMVPIAEARGRAARTAWADAKEHGVRTKLEVFGTREADILRDRGILFNSLAPGIVVPAGVSASYSPPDHQVILNSGGEFSVGTNVAYAAAHHKAKSSNRLRRLWPDHLPDAWSDYCAKHGRDALVPALQIILSGRYL